MSHKDSGPLCLIDSSLQDLRAGIRAVPCSEARIKGALSFDDDQPVGIETDPIRFETPTWRIFLDNIARSLKPTLRHVQRNEDTDAFVLSQIGSGKVTPEQA